MKISMRKTLFYCDECHNYSSRFRESLLPPFKYRLGLSAPVNDKSDLRDGEKEMMEYFGKFKIFILCYALNDPDPNVHSTL